MPYESAFARLQKFAWANSMAPQDLLRQLFARRGIPSPPARLDLFEGSWMGHRQKPPPPGLELETGLAARFGLAWMRRLCRRDALRFCEACLDQGYHSLLFQIEGIACCPLHGRAFRATCANCNVTIPLALTDQAFSFTFCCPTCHQPLGSTVDPPRWFGAHPFTAALRSSLAPLVDWLGRLSAYEITGERAPVSQLQVAGQFKGEPDTVVAFGIAQQLVPLPVVPTLLHPTRRPLVFVEINDPGSTTSPVSPFQAHAQKESLFHELTTRLLARITRHHSACLPAAELGILLQRRHAGPALGQDAGLCPVAAGFYRWHKRVLEGLIAMRRLDPEWLNTPVPLPGDDFTNELLARFHSEVATAYVSEELRLQLVSGSSAAGSALRDFQQQYSFGLDDPDAHWIIEGPPGEGPPGATSRKCMVMASGDLLQIFEH